MRRRQQLALAAVVLVAIGLAAAIAVEFNYAIRTEARWALFSGKYKSLVVGQPSRNDNELRHVEWDGWGWAGMDTAVYLIYDPNESLAAAAQSGRPGKYDGLPCAVFRVNRLEPNWYTAQFYTDTHWGWGDCK